MPGPRDGSGRVPDPGRSSNLSSGSQGWLLQARDIYGDVSVGDSTPAHSLERWRPWIRSPVTGGPSRMLVAENQVVTFTGRTEQLDALTTWRDTEVEAHGLLLHGPGGQGKTRLAAEFAQRSAQLGWEVLAARWRVRKRVAAVIESGVAEAGTLVVVDYAERWPVNDLLRLVVDAAVAPRPRTRFLFVARPGGHWWATLAQQLAEAGLDTGRAITVPPLGTGPDQRRVLFETARDRFADELGAGDVSGIGMPDWLDGDSRDHVLTIHMAAWAAVDAHTRGAASPGGLAALSSYLISRERTHWKKMHGNDERGVHFTTPDSVMVGVVFVAALTGAQPTEHATGLLLRTALATDPKDAMAVLGDHALCYPPSDPRGEFVLEPIYPDRLSEDLVALYTPGGTTDFDAEPRSADILRLVLDDDPEPRHLRHSLIHVIEAAHRWPHLARDHLVPILRARPALVRHAGGAALTRLAELPQLDVALLRAIERTLPEFNLDLGSGLVALTERLVRDTDDPTDDPTYDPVAAAAVLRRLSRRLLAVGRVEDGFAAVNRAEAILRPFVWEDPRVFVPELARTLTDYSGWLSDLGRYDEAIAVAQDAHWLRLRAAGDGSEDLGEAAIPDVAAAGGNLSVVLTRGGRPAAALTVVEDAIRLLRRGAAIDPEFFQVDLARALVQQGRVLSALGRWERAVGASTQGVLLWRLVAEQPSADGNDYRPDLAWALHDHGRFLANVERWDEAVLVVAEAVELFRQAHDADPDPYRASLADALDYLGSLRWSTGDWPAGCATAAEAVEVRRGAADGLAHSLVTLSLRQSDLYRPNSALRSATEATRILRELFADGPAAHGTSLGAACVAVARAQAILGDREAAVAAATEAVTLDRRYTQDDPVALGNSLVCLAEHLVTAGRFEDAVAAAEEAAELFDRNKDGVTRLHRAVNLMWARQVAAAALVRLGRLAEADETAARALDAVAVARRDFIVGDLLILARLLDVRSAALAGTGRADDAVATAEEAVDVLRDLAADRADHGRALAARLATLGRRYAERTQWARACEVTAEAVALRRGLVDDMPCDATVLLLARSLWQFAHVRVEGGVELPAAVEAAVEAIGLYDQCADPPAHERRSAVLTAARSLTAVGRAEDAARTLRSWDVAADAVPDVPAEW